MTGRAGGGRRGAVGRRPLATTLVHESDMDGALMSVIPRPALAILGVRHPRSAVWTRAGSYYRVAPSPGRGTGPRSIQNYISNTAIIQDTAARDLGIRDGGSLDWFVAHGPSGWEVHARGAAGTRPVTGPGGRRRAGGRTSRRPLAEGRVVDYRYSGVLHYTMTYIPLSFFWILQADEGGSIRWERSGRYWNVVPCDPDEPGARPVAKTYNTRGRRTVGHYARIPGGTRGCLGKRGTAVRWYVVHGGRGRWEVHVRPVDAG